MQNWAKLGETGRNWAKLTKIRGKNWEKLVKIDESKKNWWKLGKTDENWVKLEFWKLNGFYETRFILPIWWAGFFSGTRSENLDKFVAKNWEKLVKTGKNWWKLVKTRENWWKFGEVEKNEIRKKKVDAFYRADSVCSFFIMPTWRNGWRGGVKNL